MVWLYKLPNSCIALLFGVIGAALFVGVLFLRVKLRRIQVQSDHAKAAHDGTQRGANDSAHRAGLAFSLNGPPPTAPLYVREEAGTQRYNVGIDTPKLCATSCGGVPLANSFLAA
jgi:hypothetical protein